MAIFNCFPSIYESKAYKLLQKIVKHRAFDFAIDAVILGKSPTIAFERFEGLFCYHFSVNS
jgi:hypothetical protein